MKKPGVETNETFFRRVELVLQFLLAFFALWTLTVHGLVFLEGSFRSLLLVFPVVLSLALLGLSLFRFAPLTALGRNRGASDDGEPNTSLSALARFWPWLLLNAIGGTLMIGGPYLAGWLLVLLGFGLGWRAWARDPARRQTRAEGRPGENSAASEPPAGRERLSSLWEPAAVVALAALGAAFSLFSKRFDADDSVYLGMARGMLDHPELALNSRDFMLGWSNMPILLPVYRIHSYELLAAFFSKISHLELFTVYYLVLPPLLGAVAVFSWAVLCRYFSRRNWLLVLGFYFALSVLLGESHRSPGNFAFTRIFQGKTILVLILAPWLHLLVLRLFERTSLRNFLLLFAAQVAAVGLSSSALFLCPLLMAFAIPSAWIAHGADTRRGIRTSALAAATTLYPLALALYFRFATAAMNAEGGGSVDLQHVFTYALGESQSYLVIFSLLSGWMFARQLQIRTYLLGLLTLFFLLALSPWGAQLLADRITSEHTFWRIFWIVPVLLSCALVLSGALEWLWRRNVWEGRLGLLCLLVLALAWWPSLSLRTGLGWPEPKLGADQELLERVAHSAPAGKAVFATEALAAWLPLIEDHQKLVYSRIFYWRFFMQTPGAFSPEELKRYRASLRAINAPSLLGKPLENLRLAIEEYDVGSVVHHESQETNESNEMLTLAGFRREPAGRYVLWRFGG